VAARWLGGGSRSGVRETPLLRLPARVKAKNNSHYLLLAPGLRAENMPVISSRQLLLLKEQNNTSEEASGMWLHLQKESDIQREMREEMK